MKTQKTKNTLTSYKTDIVIPATETTYGRLVHMDLDQDDIRRPARQRKSSA